MKKILLLLTVLSVNLLVYSQAITTQGGLPVSDLIADTLINGCTTVSNVTVNGGAYGYFTDGGSSFPFESGIIMASGAISDAEGPNSTGSNTGTSPSSGSDSDLAMISAPNGINDATVIEFDFIPASDTVRFNYIFGSEEFPEYANTSYNDVFGFFLSGPGISGPYSNGAINIAILPNDQPVTINNVHNFSYYTATPNTANTVAASSYNNAVQYDGNTIVLTAEAIVTACETYHIKLAVGDAGDSSYDSGVFIEAGSFVSGAAIDVVNSSDVGDDSNLWEGCENFYVISREEGSDAAEEIVIDVMIDGNSDATEGVDFTDFPTQVVIPEGVMTDTIFYSAFNDGDDEGHETIIVAFYTACPCGNMSTAVYDTIWIYDAEFIKGGIQDVEAYYCGVDAPETLDLVGECNIDPNVDYFWSTGETTSTIAIDTEPGATSYWLTMTDICGNEVLDSITIRVSDMEQTDNITVDPSCYNECDGYIQLFMEGGVEPFNYRYANALYQFIPDSVHSTSMSTFGNLCPGTYKVTATDDIGCFIRYEYTLENPPPVDLSTGILETDMEFCENPGEITLTAESNQPDPTFVWSNTESGSSISVTPPVGENVYWVRIYDNCGNYYEDDISVKYSDMTISVTSEMDMGSCDGEVSANASDGVYPYTYYWQAPISGFGNSQTSLCTGYYDILVTDNIGCEKTETVYVEEYNSVSQSYYDDIFTIFPNPADEKFTVNYKHENSNEITMKIIDMKGAVIYESDLLNIDISISGFESGVYFVKLFDNEGMLAVQKLIVTK